MPLDKFGRTSKKLKQKVIRREIFPRTTSGDFDLQNHRVCNVGETLDEHDAVSKKYVDVWKSDYEKDRLEILGELNEMIREINKLGGALNKSFTSYNNWYKDVEKRLAALAAKVK